MASYELSAFDRQFQAISLVGAIEQQSPFSLNVGYWLRDPNQWVEWPALVSFTSTSGLFVGTDLL